MSDAEPRGVLFHPVGWEDTLAGPGRPQELINNDLRDCDYAVFVLHDRWGTPTGSYSSGTEEEWSIAEELYAATKLRRVILFFKKVDARQMTDPGDQLKQVLAFRKKVETERKHFFKPFEQADVFCEELRRQLGKWLRDHEAQTKGSDSDGRLSELSPSILGTGLADRAIPTPEFDFWIAEAMRIEDSAPGDVRDNAGILFCAGRALAVSTTDFQWARATNSIGIANFYLNKATVSFESFSAISNRFASSSTVDERAWHAKALVNKGVTLGALGRSEDAVAVYDDLLARFGTATEDELEKIVSAAKKRLKVIVKGTKAQASMKKKKKRR